MDGDWLIYYNHLVLCPAVLSIARGSLMVNSVTTLIPVECHYKRWGRFVNRLQLFNQLWEADDIGWFPAASNILYSPSLTTMYSEGRRWVDSRWPPTGCPWPPLPAPTDCCTFPFAPLQVKRLKADIDHWEHWFIFHSRQIEQYMYNSQRYWFILQNEMVILNFLFQCSFHCEHTI